jgi:uncharacterized membrane protein
MFQNLVEAAAFFVAMVTLPLGILSALFLGFTPAAVVFVVGWLLLTPLLLFAGTELLPMLRERADSSVEEPETDPLEQLKARYARGEITDAEFERRVERLVGAEDLDAVGRAGGPGAGDRTERLSGDRERSVERE